MNTKVAITFLCENAD